MKLIDVDLLLNAADAEYVFGTTGLRWLKNAPTADVVLRSEVDSDLWDTRTHLVELYHKYRNKADERSLTEEEQMFYQGRAEAIWEGIHELDELKKKYK